MDQTSRSDLPVLTDIEDAAARLSGLAVRTPLLPANALGEALGRPVYLKPECLQRTGSFKFRGAWNRVSRLRGTDAKGVVACSSGNHAQGVAAAARLAGLAATIVMPADAPVIKRRNTEALGARVVEYERDRDDRDAIAAEIADEEQAVLIPPYDDFHVIAGQGTVGLEIAEDCAVLGISPGVVAVPVGGGGLIAGTSLALSARYPEARIYGVEPAGFDDLARSLAAGSRQSNPTASGSICDALLAPTPGELTFAINRERLAGAVAVSDAEAAAAVARAFAEVKLVVEPGGAVALAAALTGRLPGGESPLVVVLSGGNVDAATYSECLKSGRRHQENSAS